MGKSRCGFTTKIHTTVDENGMPMRILLSPGNVRDIKLAGKLTAKFGINKLRMMIKNSCIPGRKNRKREIQYDKELYKKRNVVERFFQK